MCFRITETILTSRNFQGSKVGRKGRKSNISGTVRDMEKVSMEVR